MKIIRYGIVGCGYFGASLAKSLQRFDDARITMVYDPERGKEVSEFLSCTAASDLNQLVSSPEVDVVIVASSNCAHREPVVQAARNKKHVFCEKPLALSLSDVDEMVNACRENGVIFMSGHIMHFMKGVRTIKEIIASGKIGEILMAHAERTGWEGPSNPVSWKKIQEYSGGHLFHHIHELDFIQSIFGPADSVYTMGGNLCHRGNGYGTEDDALMVSFTFPGNKFATLQMGSAFHMGHHFVRISGTKGALELNMQNVGLTLKVGKDITHYTVGENQVEDDDRSGLYLNADGGVAYGNYKLSPPMWLASMIDREMEYFHRVMQGSPVSAEFAPLFNGASARASVRTMEAALQSLRTGAIVQIQK